LQRHNQKKKKKNHPPRVWERGKDEEQWPVNSPHREAKKEEEKGKGGFFFRQHKAQRDTEK